MNMVNYGMVENARIVLLQFQEKTLKNVENFKNLVDHPCVHCGSIFHEEKVVNLNDEVV